MFKFLHYMSGKSRLCQMSVGLVLTALVGLLDYLTGPELAFSIFYLIPVSMIAWLASRRCGIVMSVTSAALWLIADLLTHRFPWRYSNWQVFQTDAGTWEVPVPHNWPISHEIARRSLYLGVPSLAVPSRILANLQAPKGSEGNRCDRAFLHAPCHSVLERDSEIGVLLDHDFCRFRTAECSGSA
jgi:hypothetical protein